jgi:uncharacterized repeat protein (TIGR02543 family)
MNFVRIGASTKIACAALILLVSFAVSVPANAFPLVHTVTFFENATPSDPVTAFENGTSPQALTMLQDLSPSFSNVGYSFSGWNTSINGSGVPYSDGSSYPFSADTSLYAQWAVIPLVHTVTFYENASASDTDTAFENGTSPQALTMLQDLSPSFSNVGYSFSGWNTSINGSGVPYSDGSSYPFSADTSLYAQWAVIPLVHTVTFYENASASDTNTAFENGTSPQALTMLQDLSPSFSNVGYSFSGWNTSINGSGVPYSDGSSYPFSADTSLYAQWIADAVVHTVTFLENDTPSDAIASYQSASVSTLLTAVANLDPAFSNPGYVFTGWNTTAGDSGITYADGTNYSFDTDMTLYAQWSATVVIHTVILHENDSATDTTTSNTSESAPTPLILFVNLDPQFSNSGQNFIGWNTSANGSGVAYADGSIYSFATNLNLYAQWAVNVEVHTVTFNENDNAADTVSSEISHNDASPLTLFADLQPRFTNASQSFSSWNTARDGTGISYADGAQYGFEADLVLYAQWTSNTIDTISFSANGGSGTVASIIGSPGSIVTVPCQTGLIRVGFVLTNWNTNALGSGTTFRVGQSVTLAESVELFAQWSGHVPATLFGAIGIFKTDSSSLSANLKSQVDRIANTIRTRRFLKVDLFGYTAETGLKSFNVSLSRARAKNVAIFLRSRLRALKVVGVTVLSSGEGAIAGQSNGAYSRVEVFGV